MRKTLNIRHLLAVLSLASLLAFFFVNSQSGFLSELTLPAAGKEVKIPEREQSEEQQESARIPGLFTLSRLLELAGKLVERGF